MAMRKQEEIADDGWAWVEIWLDRWARWMRGRAVHLEAPSRSPGFLTDISGGYRDAEELAELAGHAKACDIIEATLDDLAPAERAAVWNIHLHAVYRLRVPLLEAYARARQAIGQRLRAHAFY